jgi:hypothetical protein
MSRTYHATRSTDGARRQLDGREAAQAYRERNARQAARLAKYAEEARKEATQ